MTDLAVSVKVTGEYACFTRPEMKVERVSYEVPTPSAARGILDAILWRPEMRWHIRSISVLRPIRFQKLKRNEIQSKIPLKDKKHGYGLLSWMNDPTTYSPQPAGAGSTDVTQRNTVALRDVAYVITAEPVVFDSSGDNTPQKYVCMFNRRLGKGQCHSQPYLGCREFAGYFEPPTAEDTPITDSRPLGLMLYDIIFDPSSARNVPVFFRAEMREGVIYTDAQKVIEDANLRKEVLKCSCKR